jgi:hypothetical protein
MVILNCTEIVLQIQKLTKLYFAIESGFAVLTIVFRKIILLSCSRVMWSNNHHVKCIGGFEICRE